jgi:mRNA-degrading endonuclease toxin of MazEF toxin-antitoxin module
MRRGDVVLVADHGGGDHAGKPRPAVMVQSELYDRTLSVVGGEGGCVRPAFA